MERVFQPLVDVREEAVFGVINPNAGGDVHSGHQNHALAHTALLQSAVHLASNVDVLAMFFGVERQVFGVKSHKTPPADQSRRVTMVAPQPPASAGASPKLSTKEVRASTVRTISRCTPIPRPWMMRRARNPRRCASIRYSSTMGFTSRGGTVCRSKISVIGIRIGSSSIAVASAHRPKPVQSAETSLGAADTSVYATSLTHRLKPVLPQVASLTLVNPAAEYSNRLTSRTAAHDHYDRLHRKIGNIRLAVGMAGVTIRFFLFSTVAISPLWLPAPVSPFSRLGSF